MFQTSKTTLSIREKVNDGYRTERARLRPGNRGWKRRADDAIRRADVILKLDSIRAGVL